MTQDIIWTDGKTEVLFIGKQSLERAQAVQQTYGFGKVWRRTFSDDGHLEGITDVTNERPVQSVRPADEGRTD